MVQLVTRGVLVNETFIGGSALMNMQSDGMSVTSSGRVILLTHYVVGLARFLVNHGGLLYWQHVPPPSQTWPSQSVALG